ncbi:MAG: CheY-like chemotaxis protein [Verrucomicrobiales bacterium]|jgi:CheY-like chemotaxis protein
MAQIAHTPQNSDPSSKRHVLLIDDEASFTSLVKDALEATGRYEVSCLHDASLAEEQARELRPDVVLVDIIMPSRDGAEVMAAFENDPELSRIPMIVMSAFLNNRVFPNSPVDFGDHQVLEKPMDLGELDQLVEKIEAELARLGNAE